MHPPGHGPERLQDRQRVGAGNYKSNPSSRGVKLQRKRTSQGRGKKEKRKKNGLHAVVQLIPVRSGHRSWKSCKSHQKEAGKQTKLAPKRRGGSPRGSLGVPPGSDGRAAAAEPGGGARGRGEQRARGRAGGWTLGKMQRRRARRGGFRAPAGRGAGRRAAAVSGGRGAAVHTWSAAGTQGPEA